jgi:lysophospholipase L1-like esterase
MQTITYPHRTVDRESNRDPLRIIALGDSLIYGYGDPVGGGWVERLRRKWMNPEEPGHVLYNLGIRGNGIVQVAQRLEQEFRHRGELRNRFPDLIILSVGVNDSPRLGKPDGKNFTKLEDFEIHLANAIEQAKRLAPVLFIGMVPVDETKMPFLDCLYYNHQDQYRYKEAIRKACQIRQVPYLDIFSLWMERDETWRKSRLCADGLHPNTLGYETLLADILNWEIFANLISVD